MNLEPFSWKEFRLGDLFFTQYGVNLELVNCTPSTSPNSINFVARTSENNGVVARVEPIDGIVPQPAGTITCAAGGSVLSTFVQTRDFYSGRDLYLLLPKTPILFMPNFSAVLSSQKTNTAIIMDVRQIKHLTI